MANEQPAPTPAPAPASPQTPAPEPGTQPAAQPSAEQTPNPTPAPSAFDSLGDEDKAYLKSQGIEDLSKPENVEKLLKHNLSLRQSSSQTAAELARIKSSISGTPEPANPGASGPAPTTAPSQNTTTELDPVTAYTLATSFAQQFPSVKEDLVSGKFYQDFASTGRSLTDAQGRVNIAGLQAYGQERQRISELEAKVAEYEKPNPNSIPSAEPQTPQQPADDAPMTKQMAMAILVQDPNHARAAEAKQFLSTAK